MKYKYIGNEKQLIEHGFKNEFGTLMYARDIGVYCEVQQENETLYINLWHGYLWEREIDFNGGWMEELNIEDYIQDLIDDNLVEVQE